MRNFSTGNRLSAGDVSVVDITGTKISLFCWVKLDSTSGDCEFMSKMNYVSTQVQYALGHSSGTAQMEIGDATGGDSVSVGSFTVGQWSSVVGTYDGSQLMVWKMPGGSIGVATSTRSIQNTGQSFTFGDRSDGGGGDYDGQIGQAALWNAALTRDECLRLHQGAVPTSIRPGSLRAYWPLTDYGVSGAGRDMWFNLAPLTQTNTATLLPGPWLPSAPRQHVLQTPDVLGGVAPLIVSSP